MKSVDFIEEKGPERVIREPLPEKFQSNVQDKLLLGPPKEQIQAAFNLLREVKHSFQFSNLKLVC